MSGARGAASDMPVPVPGAPTVAIKFAGQPRDTVLKALMAIPMEQRVAFAKTLGLSYQQMMKEARKLPQFNPNKTLLGP